MNNTLLQQKKNLHINIDRLMKNLFELGKIGQNNQGGIDRPLASTADIESRKWLKNYWSWELHREAVTDAAANLWITMDGNRKMKPIVIGSHNDSVIDGGKYDGALGVLMATEVMCTLQENRVSLRHPLCVVSLTGEEPNAYNISTLGSKVIAGRIGRPELSLLSSRESGEKLLDAIGRLGGNAAEPEKARLSGNRLAAFLECHIEQGKNLDSRDLSVATVSTITGIYRERITVSGESNHAGTTWMSDRKDALLGAANLILKLDDLVKRHGDIVATTGRIEVLPNEVNIIPSEATMTIDIRTCDSGRLAETLSSFEMVCREAEKKYGVQISRTCILNQPPQPMSKVVQQAINQACGDIGESVTVLNSMAGHDAANFAKITETGMIFVRSVNGRSHCREEYSRPEDIRKAADLMLASVRHLDRMLD